MTVKTWIENPKTIENVERVMVTADDFANVYIATLWIKGGEKITLELTEIREILNDLIN